MSHRQTDRQTVRKFIDRFQDEPNQLFVVKKSKSVDAVNKKLYNSVYFPLFNDFKQLPTQETRPSECAVTIKIKSNPI